MSRVAESRPGRRVSGALALAAVVALSACTPGSTTAPTAEPSPTAPAPGARPDVGVQLFQWTWDAIGRECTDVLGPAGYGWVLTSPPQEHVLGEQWWTAYQPVSYLLESRLGTREQFAAMVETCRTAGVEVIADAVINHMTGQDEPGVGWAGSPYEHYTYPGLYTPDDFHHCGLTSNDDIGRYTDAVEIQTCELVNLADLDTASPTVRATIVEYLQDLLSLGVAGFRIDAAKHIPAAEVSAIVGELPAGTRILQEVIGAVGEPVQPADYLAAGDVFDFAYGQELAGYVGGGSLGRVPELGTGSSALPGDQALVFVDNHDTERNGSTLTYKDGPTYSLATVLMIAGDHGTPVVLSGYAFRERDTGPPQDADGAVRDAECGALGPDAVFDVGEWVCQHRWPAVAGAVGWRSAVAGVPVDVVSERRVLGLGHGRAGFLGANGGSSAAEHTFGTALAPGRYCDVLTGPALDDGCAGDVVEVAQDGSITITVEPRTAFAVHSGARPAT